MKASRRLGFSLRSPLLAPQFSGVCLFIALVSGLSGASPATADTEVYQYVDADGIISLTNVPSDARYRRVIPPSNRLRSPLSEAELEPTILRFSNRYQLPPALIRAVIKAESDFDARAVSRAGAVGLMQLMPQTAVRLDVQDLYDPEDNIGGGTKYLRFLLDKFRGDLPLALAAYNAGEHVVDRYRALPPIEETRRYVRKVLRYYRTFLMRDLAVSDGTTMSSRAFAYRPESEFYASPSR